MAAALANRLGEVSLAAAKFLHQPAIGLRFLERRQVLTLQVLDQRDFERFGIGDRANDDRDLVQSEALCGAPPPLTGDKLEVHLLAGQRPHEQWLQDALLANRLGERFELGLGEPPPRLKYSRPDQLDRNATLPRGVDGCDAVRLTEQRREAAAELTPCRALAHRAAVPVRRNTSATSRI